MALLSVLQLRRRIYELFVRAHLPSSIGILTLLCFHVKPLSTYVLICLIVSASLLLLQRLSWLIFFIYRNCGVGPACRASIVRFPHNTPGEDVLQVRIDLKKPWNLTPGQFVYISIPALRILRLGILESHPFMVAWPIKDEKEQLSSIVLLIQARRGFTRNLQLADYKVSALIDGPYGDSGTQALGNYDKILLMSSGIGLAAHLSTARHLLLAHNQQTARVRRLTLVWLLETQGNILLLHYCKTDWRTDQMRWAEEFLCALDDMDSRQILTIFLFYPSDTEGAAEGYRTIFTSPRKRILAVPDVLDMTWLIESEWGAEAGNMLVTGKLNSGDSSFSIANAFQFVVAPASSFA
jgi:predicted ferric reductase